MIKLANKFVHSFKILAVAFALLICVFSSTAIAAQTCIMEGPVPIKDGSFSLSVTDPAPAFTVRSAIVSLPDGETGDLESIIIIGPNGEREFGCGSKEYPIKVENGTDLIPACGGPAVLKAGDTTYEAKGSNFGPMGNFDTFSVTLCDDFAN